jgi:hypothetical protein
MKLAFAWPPHKHKRTREGHYTQNGSQWHNGTQHGMTWQLIKHLTILWDILWRCQYLDHTAHNDMLTNKTRLIWRKLAFAWPPHKHKRTSVTEPSCSARHVSSWLCLMWGVMQDELRRMSQDYSLLRGSISEFHCQDSGEQWESLVTNTVFGTELLTCNPSNSTLEGYHSTITFRETVSGAGTLTHPLADQEFNFTCALMSVLLKCFHTLYTEYACCLCARASHVTTTDTQVSHHETRGPHIDGCDESCPMAVAFDLFCFSTPRCNSSTLYPQSCWVYNSSYTQPKIN